MRLVSCISVALVCLTAAGCHKRSPIVGDWKSERPVKQFSTVSKFHFGEDGVYKEDSTLMNPNGAGIELVATGRWTLAGETLTTAVTDVTMKPINMTPESEQRAAARFPKVRAKILENEKKEPNSHLRFFGDGAVVIENKDESFRILRD